MIYALGPFRLDTHDAVLFRGRAACCGHGRCSPKWQLSVVVLVALGLLCHSFVPVSIRTCTNKPTLCVRSALGIQVSPNASGVLHGLGRGDPLAKLGVRPFAFHFHSWGDGRFLSRRKRNSWIGPRANILTSKKCVLCETSPVAARATRRKSIFSTHGDRKTF
jgi:hypothetical protein